jgi:hypothetical protein
MPAENRYGKVVNSGHPAPGVTLSQLCCGALHPSLCCASVLGQQQSFRSLVTLEKDELMKDLLVSSKVGRKNRWLSKPAQRGEKIEPINVHRHACNSEDWHFCRLIPCCVYWIHNFLLFQQDNSHKNKTSTDRAACHNTLAHTATFPLLGS